MAPDTLAMTLAGLITAGATPAAMVAGRWQYKINERNREAKAATDAQASADKNRELDIRQQELDAKKDDDNNKLATQLREDLREERLALQTEVVSLRKEVTGLRTEIEGMRHEIATHKDGRERAESRCEKLQSEVNELNIQLNAALRGQDAFSIAATVRKKLQEENEKKSKGESIDPNDS